MLKALHRHDCDSCVLIGRNGDTPQDVYFCPISETVIVRSSDSEPDYASLPYLFAVAVETSERGSWTLPFALASAFVAGRESRG